MPENDGPTKQDLVTNLRQAADSAGRLSLEQSKAASDLRVQAEGNQAIRDSLVELARAVERLPGEIVLTDPSSSAGLRAFNVAIQGMAGSMGLELQRAEDMGRAVETGLIAVASNATTAATGTYFVMNSLPTLHIVVPQTTLERLERYRGGLGSPAREKVRELLREVRPEYVHQYDEVWPALARGTPEAILSAASLMRQLVFWVLMQLAPDDEVMAQPWYKVPKDTNLKVTRSQRVQYVFRGHPSSAEYTNSLLSILPVDLETLHGSVHGDPAVHRDRGAIENAISALDVVLYTILAVRTDPAPAPGSPP